VSLRTRKALGLVRKFGLWHAKGVLTPCARSFSDWSY